MQNLFVTGVSDQIIERVNRLHPSSQALWGKMNVAQMLSHCQAPLEVALGERVLKVGLMGFFFGKIAKSILLKDTPFRKNLPTDKNFIRTGNHNLFEEKEKLQTLILKFSNANQQQMESVSHPIFGKMTAEEWGMLNWKHLDHHLKQFGN